MGLYDYEQAKALEGQDVGFYALIMAAMRRADTHNLERLQAAWPAVWEELQARYHAPAGALTPEEFASILARANGEGDPVEDQLDDFAGEGGDQ